MNPELNASKRLIYANRMFKYSNRAVKSFSYRNYNEHNSADAKNKKNTGRIFGKFWKE